MEIIGTCVDCVSASNLTVTFCVAFVGLLLAVRHDLAKALPATVRAQR